ncbi:MAG TPA: hypothetical protein VMG12_40725 [Polyangiaceae bacterium]|nr:hypothetical protein [Polyangiaceae bacterium]
MIGIDARFACALSTALDPWGLALIDSDAESPGSSMPSTSLSARAIAEKHGARAVIWLGSDPAGHALWVYDASSDRSVSRAVPAPPFTPSVSASLALSVKTTLRMVALAPDPAPSPDEPPAAVDVPEPEPFQLNEPPPPPRPPPPRWLLGVHAGVQLGPLENDARDARYGVTLRWSSTEPGLRPWLALDFAAGLPLRVLEPELDGRVWDAATALAIGVTQPLGDVWAVSLAGGAGLHVTALTGTARMDGAAVSNLQVNPTLRLEGELQANLGGLVLGLEPNVEYWLRGQRYEVLGVRVLDHRRRAFGLGLVAWVPID